MILTVGSHVVAIVAIMASFLPAFIGIQTNAWHNFMAQLRGLGFELFSSGSMSSSVFTVLTIVTIFLGISFLQSSLFDLMSIFDVDRQWYQKQHQHVRNHVQIQNCAVSFEYSNRLFVFLVI